MTRQEKHPWWRPFDPMLQVFNPHNAPEEMKPMGRSLTFRRLRQMYREHQAKIDQIVREV